MKRKPCDTLECVNRAAPGRSVCHTCFSRRVKKINPFFYHFNALRNNARRRGIAFTITLEDFKEFCFETEYMNKKGKRGSALTVDRIDDSKGYVPGNLQALPHKENSVKKKVVYDHFAEKKFTTVTVKKFSTPPPFAKRSRWIRNTISSLLTKTDVPF